MRSPMTRRAAVLVGAFLLIPVAASPAVTAEGAAAGERVILERVDRYRVVEPLFECVRVVLSFRGETYSPAYVQGISGAAFRIGGPCPCAPTCEWAMSTDKLIHLLGYEYERLGVPAEGPEREPAMQRMLARIKDEIRAGRPALLWHIFTACENDVVAGFDDGKHALYGRGSYAGLEAYAEANEMRPLEATEGCGGPHAILIGEKTGSFEARAAELAALKGAVLHARGASAARGFAGPVGLECYDQWIASYRAYSSKFGVLAANSPTDGYVLSILSSTRRAASESMRELAPKYPDAAAHLEMAAEHFARESAALQACHKVGADGPQKPTEDQCLRSAAYLSEARAMYALAIEEIARALRIMEPVAWELP